MQDAMKLFSCLMFGLTCQRAEALGTDANSTHTHPQTLFPSPPFFNTHEAPHDAKVTAHPQRPYLSAFLIRMALKMFSRGVFSRSWVGCTKGCRATSEKPCWYSSSSWAGRSRREVSLTAEARGSSAESGERGGSSETHPDRPPHVSTSLSPQLSRKSPGRLSVT